MSDIRSSGDFFGRLGQDYKDNKENSFLFRHIKSEYDDLSEETRGLFEKIKDDQDLIRQCLLLSPAKINKSSAVHEDERKQEHSRRSCFYKELYQNYEAAKRGIIQPEDCLMWLLEYLSSHILLCRNVMFKGSRIYSPRENKCVEALLRAGLDEHIISDLKDNKDEFIHIKRLLSDETGRVELKEKLKSIKGDLAEITGIFLEAAIHREAVTFLKDSGNARKKDKTLNMFFKFAGSDTGRSCSDGRYFYYIDETDSRGEIRQLMKALNTKWESGLGYRLFIPLVADMYTGCVLFIAGKDNYQDVYSRIVKEDIRNAYRDCADKVCFDYLRVKEEGYKEYRGYMMIPDKMPEGFHLMPDFHINAGISYEEILARFKKYCDRVFKEVVQTNNEERPDGIPDIFAKFFIEDVDQGVSDESREDFYKTVKKNLPNGRKRNSSAFFA